MTIAGTTPDAMTRLLAPLGLEEFIDRYWANRALHVPGTPAKFRDLFDEQRFWVAVAPRPGTPEDPAFLCNAVLPARDDQPLTRMSTEPVQPERIDEVLARGTTICVNKISAHDERLHAVAASAGRELGWTGSVWFNSYLSPDASGADLHWDTQVTTTLQISGRKRWRYAARPSLAWPERPAYMAPDGTVTYYGREVEAEEIRATPGNPAVFHEVVLEPGDLLCLPAGTWHSAKGVGPSLALNLAFSRPRTADLVGAVVQSLLGLDMEWRSSLRPVPRGGDSGTPVPADVVSTLAKQLAEAGRALDSVTPEDRVITDAWRQLIRQH